MQGVMQKVSLFWSGAKPPPFLLDEANGEVGLKFVFFGADREQIEQQFKSVTESWPERLRSETQIVSAPNHPEAGAAFFVQRLMPESESINGHRVRLHVFASTAPIDGPDAGGQAVLLRQAACVVVLDGSADKAVAALDSLLAQVASKPRRPPVVVFVGQAPASAPKKWTTLVAPSPAEAIEVGFHKVAALIQ
jgi:hypothetical protein